jgi:SprT-like family
LVLAGVLVVAGVSWSAWSQSAARSAGAGAGLTPADKALHDLLRADLDKPGDPALDAMYGRINAAHFAGALPAIPVRWEPGLAGIGSLSAQAFVQEGLFGHIGKRAMILLNPELRHDAPALERALCHEIVHGYLYSTGDTTTNHGPAFQAVLTRLAAEGAFEGIVATDADRTKLRAWLDAESRRLDAEQQDLKRLDRELEDERIDIEHEVADLNARAATARAGGATGPTATEVAAANERREAYNQRAVDARARAERDQADQAHFNAEVTRYNLMLVYPDGLDEDRQVAPRATAPLPGGQRP